MARANVVKKNLKSGKAATTKRNKNFILRDHNLDLVVHGKRKRTPTQRAIEAQALLRPSKKIKKTLPKKLKRLGTMQQTAKEATEFLKNNEPKKNRGKSPAKKTEQATEQEKPLKKSGDVEKEQKRGRSHSTKGESSKTKKSVSRSRSERGNKRDKSKGKSKSKSKSGKSVEKRSKSKGKDTKDDKTKVKKASKKGNDEAAVTGAKKKVLKRTRTIKETIKTAKKFLKSA